MITYGELLYGANKSEQRARSLATIQEFARVVPPLPLPENAAEAYGFIRAGLEGRIEDTKLGEVILSRPTERPANYDH